LARGYRLWRMPVLLMSGRPDLPGHFDRYGDRAAVLLL
jgi:hypothetical protein